MPNELDMEAYHSKNGEIDPGEHKVFNISPTVHTFNQRWVGTSDMGRNLGDTFNQRFEGVSDKLPIQVPGENYDRTRTSFVNVGVEPFPDQPDYSRGGEMSILPYNPDLPEYQQKYPKSFKPEDVEEFRQQQLEEFYRPNEGGYTPVSEKGPKSPLQIPELDIPLVGKPSKDPMLGPVTKEGGTSTAKGSRPLNPERINKAAIRIRNNVYEGLMHFDAIEAAKRAGESVKSLYGGEAEEGFTTSTGRFVNRAEAQEIALGRKQIPKREQGYWLTPQGKTELENINTEGRTLTDIGNELGITKGRVSQLFKRHGIEPYYSIGGRIDEELGNKITELKGKGYSNAGIARELQISPAAVTQKIKRMNDVPDWFKEEMNDPETQALSGWMKNQFEGGPVEPTYESLESAKGRSNEEQLLKQRQRQIKYDKKLSGIQDEPSGELNAIKERLNLLKQPETIAAAAIRHPDTGKVYTGSAHYMAVEKAGSEDYPLYEVYNQPWEEGFTTSKGRFVDREEAAKIQREATGHYGHNKLISEDVHKLREEKRNRYKPLTDEDRADLLKAWKDIIEKK